MRESRPNGGMCGVWLAAALILGCDDDGGSSTDAPSGAAAANGGSDTADGGPSGGTDAVGGMDGTGGTGTTGPSPEGGAAGEVGLGGSAGAAGSVGGSSGAATGGFEGTAGSAGGSSAATGGAVGETGGSTGTTGGFAGAAGSLGGSSSATGGSAGSAATCAHDGEVPSVVLSDGDSLQATIDAATDGGVIWLGPGTYSCVEIEQRAFSATSPLIVRSDPTRPGDVRIVPGDCWFAVRIVESSYVVLDGLHVDGGGIGVYVDLSDHVILSGLEVDNCDQEGIQIRNDSTYVDVLGSHIHHTGIIEARWGECIYVGTGSEDDFPDHTEYVWIEGNEIHHCGAAEGVNIKPEVFSTTVRGNVIHDITPGTSDQYNQSGLTVEGESRDYLPTTPREIWVENNEIYAVTLGEWGHCAMIGGTGVYFVHNVIHDCDEYGIYGNGFGDLGLFLVLFDNDVTDVGSEPIWVADSIALDESDPGPSPLHRQDWYCH
jgi:hypothetical protein